MPQAFSVVHSRIFLPTALGGTVLVLAFPATPGLVLVAGVVGLVALGSGAFVLSREEGLPPLDFAARPANLVTLSRIILLTAALVLGLGSSEGYLLAGVLSLLAWATDLVDGWLARRAGPPGTPERALGGWLDAETDSLGFLMASWALASFPQVPGWVVLIGLYRYGFGLLFRLIPWSFRFPPWFQTASRIVAAGSQVVLAVSWLAVLDLLPLPTGGLLVAWGVTVGLLGASFLTETALRFEAFRSVTQGAAKGLFRSLLIYHHQPFRQVRLRHFYSSLIKPGDIAFDVGAHVGNRVRAWRALGATVVAFEPQGACRALLDHWFGADPRVKVLGEGLGRQAGRLLLRRPKNNPTLASFSVPWIQTLGRVPGFEATHWDQEEWAPVTTLDAALARFGTPAFVKIDVEGFEAEVLAGLSAPLPALSFEFVPGALSPALACLDRLSSLGVYEFNLSTGESMRFAWSEWVDEKALRAHLAGLGPHDRGGDLYARLRDESR